MLSQVPLESVPRQLSPYQMMNMQQGMGMSPADIAPPGARETHRNYVFVDEHNRHKRLKVMRACEGCRRRKIKCDAATNNHWPCSACQRLKLVCVPPAAQYERDFGTGQMGMNHIQYNHAPNPSSAEAQMLQAQQRMMRKASGVEMPTYHRAPNAYQHAMGMHEAQHQHQQAHPHAQSMSYTNMGTGESMHSPVTGIQMQQPVYHSPPPLQQQRQPDSWSSPQHQGSEYSDDVAGAQLRMENLAVDDAGVAQYISSQVKEMVNAPAFEEIEGETEPNNPTFMPKQHEYAVTLQETDLPSEDDIQELFSIFFNHCHPYLPVVNKADFLRSWETSRDSVSPLLVEAIFGCAGRLTLDPARGLKWIALASKHTDAFMDVPRLSTVQALLLLLKARESAPQRGYFFRSWMSIVTIITMARDLGLDTHYKLHQNGRTCDRDPLDCMTRTRVWQACFSYELMIAAPQGRERMQCDLESIDESLPSQNHDFLDDHEYAIHAQFIQLIRLQKTIRAMADMHSKLKANPKWRNDPQFLQSAPKLDNWQANLPPYLRLHVSTDLNDPPPLLGAHVGSHFAANLQVYYWLARMMLHRPALALGGTFTDNGWRHHMMECTVAAKSICRLEEVVFEQCGMLGFQCMSRGVNFSIYSLLSCAMIHLIAATCPDPTFSTDAKEYFTRTMRLLENCIDNSASQEVKGQIEALRQAFSVDTNQPFVLNPNFPYFNGGGAPSPVATSLASAAYSQSETVQSTLASTTQVNYNAHPLSPAHSHSEIESRGGQSPQAVQSLVMMANGGQQMPATTNIAEQVKQAQWNPAQLFSNWNAAFGAGANSVTAAMQPQAASMNAVGRENGMVDSLGTSGPSPSAASFNPQPSSVGYAVSSFITPGMWQDSVAAAFSDASGHSNKRPYAFGAGADTTASWVSQHPPSQSHSSPGGMRTPSTASTPSNMPPTLKSDGRGSFSH